MYKKKKKINERAVDKRLETFCDDILELNPDAFFAISKKFVENPDKSLKSEIKGLPVIVSSLEIKDLTIPSGYSIVDNYLTTWCDDEPLVKIIHSDMMFIDGDVNGKTIKGLYLDIDKDREFKESTSFISF